MDFSAAHTGYVVLSYGLSAIGLIAISVYILWRDRRLARQVKNLGEKANSQS
jgi:heme exporter protein CcmD